MVNVGGGWVDPAGAAPQITPGENGYLAPISLSPWENPYTPQATAHQSYADTQLPKIQNNIQSMSQKAQKSDYPTFPNAFGLGSQNAFSSTQSQPTITTGSQSFNPWSLQGEALARGNY